jgi:hypothetical protein
LEERLSDPLAAWRRYREVQANRISEMTAVKNPQLLYPYGV